MSRSLPAPIEAMLNQLGEVALAELDRALTLRLHPAPTPAERRVAELGFLSQLVAEARDASSPSVPRIEQAVYEQRRRAVGSGAPTAETLAARYGGWRPACRAAFGLLPDGRYVGKGKPWASPARGRKKIPAYTLEEVHAAIRRCALELGRMPSSGDYHWWSREKRRLLRARGVQLETSTLPEHRIPGIEALYRHYPAGAARFRQAVRDSNLSEVDVAIARARHLLPSLEISEVADGPLAALRELHSRTNIVRAGNRDEAHATAGLLDACIAQIEEHGFGCLSLRNAVQIARLLGGSLDWLAGRSTSRGSPPAGDRFDAAQFDSRARKLKLAARLIREKLALPAGPYRRLMSGADEPVLVELAILASLTRVAMNDLLTVPSSH